MMGAIPGSREPDPCSTGSGPSSFDPERWASSRFARLLRDLKADGGELALRAGHCIDDLADAIEGMCFQFGGHTSKDGEAAICTMGLSDLEGAFDLLGWDEPHQTPEVTCDEPGCDHWSTCGTATSDGYRHTCYKHSPHASAMETRRAETGNTDSVAKP
jgi:hypothetical protein